jgi:hypothetical protein
MEVASADILSGVPEVAHRGIIKPNRDLMIHVMASLAKKSGALPEYGVMGFGTWAKFADDFTPDERPREQPRGERPFLEVAGVPIYPYPDIKEGEVIFFHASEPGSRGKFTGLQFIEV